MTILVVFVSQLIFIDNIGRIRNLLTFDAIEQFIHALNTTRLDVFIVSNYLI